MKRLLFYFLVLCLGLFLGFNAFSKEDDKSKQAWSKQRTLYNEGFKDGFNGRKANPEYEKNEYYTDGYSEGNKAIVVGQQ